MNYTSEVSHIENMLHKYNMTVCDKFFAIICIDCGYLVDTQTIQYHHRTKHERIVPPYMQAMFNKVLWQKVVVPREYEIPSAELQDPIKGNLEINIRHYYNFRLSMPFLYGVLFSF
jgi:hypothetical protein